MFTEKSLQEARIEDLETLMILRKNNLDFNTKIYAMIYYSLTLANLYENRNAISMFDKFCEDFLSVNPYKDKQAIYSRQEMIARIDSNKPKPLSTKYIIQNLKITEEEQKKMKLLFGEEEAKRRNQKRLNQIYNQSDKTIPKKDDSNDFNSYTGAWDEDDESDPMKIIKGDDDDLPF